MMSILSSKSVVAICLGASLAGCSADAGNVGSGYASSTLPAQHGSSRYSRAAVSDNLLYVSSLATDSVYIYTYPQGRIVGTLTGFIQPLGLCADSVGDVFVTASANKSYSSGLIYEYAHGGTTPIATLTDPGVAVGCAIDPKTGNLAASGNGVAIYKNAAGSPTYYSSSVAFYFCGYDDEGNLYLSAGSNEHANQANLFRLATGSDELLHINLAAPLYATSDLKPSVQWDGRHITVSSAADSSRGGPISVYRLSFSGSDAIIVGTTTLSSAKNHYGGELLISGKRILGTYAAGRQADVGLWQYPKGGVPIQSVGKVKGAYFSIWGLALSATDRADRL